eukprot:281715-Chlamydomonas_euryale.AAC.1
MLARLDENPPSVMSRPPTVTPTGATPPTPQVKHPSERGGTSVACPCLRTYGQLEGGGRSVACP